MSEPLVRKPTKAERSEEYKNFTTTELKEMAQELASHMSRQSSMRSQDHEMADLKATSWKWLAIQEELNSRPYDVNTTGAAASEEDNGEL